MKRRAMTSCARQLAMLALCTAAAVAQSNLGSISGTVFDPSRAVLAGADVQVTNIGTNQILRLKTSHEGSFTANALPPASYRILVDAPGFKTAVLDDVKVDTASTTGVNITLQPGDISTRIDISATTTVLQTDSGTASQTLRQREFYDLPSPTRSVLDLALTMPTVHGDQDNEDPVVGNAVPQPGGAISVGGGRFGVTGYLADGANNTGAGIARTVVSFSPEVVEEFTVMTSSFSAKYGQAGGGIINTTTKSGTNQLRGTALWSNKNPFFDAGPYTDNTVGRPSPALHSNSGGLMLGGPVYLPKIYDGRNKTFFFVAVEPRHNTDGVITDGIWPTAAQAGGNFSNSVLVGGYPVPASVAQQLGVNVTGPVTLYQRFAQNNGGLTPITLASGQQYPIFPNATIPQSLLDPFAQYLSTNFPKSGNYYVDSSGNVVNWSAYRSVKTDDKRWSVKLDQIIKSNDRLTFRVTEVPNLGARGFGGTGQNPLMANVTDYSQSGQFLLGYTHIFSPTMINDLKLNYTRGVYTRSDPPMWTTGSQDFNKEHNLPALVKGLPDIADGLSWAMGQSQLEPNFGPQIENSYGISNAFSWTHGNMSWEFGIDLRKQQEKIASTEYAAGGAYAVSQKDTEDAAGDSSTGLTYASFLEGIINSVTLRDAVIPYYYTWNTVAGYVQNDWKVKPNLTLNLGFRYGLELPQTEKYNHQGYLDPALAESFPLTSVAQSGSGANAIPLTGPNGILKTPSGQPITSALVVPFVFSGIGGRSRYLTPVDYRAWEPRFGFAWVPHFGWNQNSRLVVRGGYGLSHSPLTGLGRSATPDFALPAGSQSEIGGGVNPTQAMTFTSNPPAFTPISETQAINIPANGINYLGALGLTSFAVSPNFRTPYAQTWNLTIATQLPWQLMLEVAYTGTKGTHLYEPASNLNPQSTSVINQLEELNIDPQTNVADPLGRKNASGSVITVPIGSLATQYLGVSSLPIGLDASAVSIYNAGYVSVRRNFANGLSFTGNYTFAKSIDDASDGGSFTNMLTISPRTDGYAALGFPISMDRSPSTFDIRHDIKGTAIYQLPIGRGHRFLNGIPRWMDMAIGGFQVAGTSIFHSSMPMSVFMRNGNDTGAPGYDIRYDLVPGVPIVNPLYTPNCNSGSSCEPYFNEAAFMMPPEGQLGNLARTLDWARGPWSKTVNLSAQKNIYPWGKDSHRYFQLRMDAANAFNHPNKITQAGTSSSQYGGATYPTQTNLTTAQYNTWAAYNNQPLYSTTAGAAIYNNIVAMVNSQRAPGVTNLVPANFYSIPVPQGFATTNVNAFNITTLEGYKLYMIKQQYTSSFGQLGVVGWARERQVLFTVKFFF